MLGRNLSFCSFIYSFVNTECFLWQALRILGIVSDLIEIPFLEGTHTEEIT